METKELLRQVLGESLYFKGLQEPLLSKIAEIAVIKSYDKGEEIFSEGEKAFGFYLVLDGYVKIYRLSSKGKELIIHLLGRGEIFAEIVLAGVDKYPAYAQALTTTKLALFEKVKFLRFIQGNPELALNMIGIFALKLKSLLKSIDALSLKEAKERLIMYLWDLSEEGKKESFDLEVNKTHLALLLGITPETLSRLFQKLKEEELLGISQKRLTLLNLHKWKQIIREI